MSRYLRGAFVRTRTRRPTTVYRRGRKRTTTNPAYSTLVRRISAIEKTAETGYAKIHFMDPRVLPRLSKLTTNGNNASTWYPFHAAGRCAVYHADTIFRQHKGGIKDCCVDSFQYDTKSTIHGDHATLKYLNFQIKLSNVQVDVTRGLVPGFKYISDTRQSGSDHNIMYYGQLPQQTAPSTVAIPSNHYVKYRVIVFRTANAQKDGAAPEYFGPCANARRSDRKDRATITSLWGLDTSTDTTPTYELKDQYNVVPSSHDFIAATGTGEHELGDGPDPVTSFAPAAPEHQHEMYVEEKGFGPQSLHEQTQSDFLMFKSTSSAFDPAIAKVNTAYAKEVIYDKVIDCTGRTMMDVPVLTRTQNLVPGDQDEPAEQAAAGFTYQSLRPQAACYRTLNVRVPKDRLETPLRFPTTRKPGEYEHFVQKVHEADPEWGCPATAVSQAPTTADTELADFRPGDLCMPHLHAITADPLTDESCNPAATADPSDQQGPRRFDFRPINHRWKVAIIPFMVEKSNGASVSGSPTCFRQVVAPAAPLTGTTDRVWQTSTINVVRSFASSVSVAAAWTE